MIKEDSLLRRFVVYMILICSSMFAFSGSVLAESENDIVIKRGTEVLVKILQRVKSNKVHTGEVIRFSVERAVKNDNGFTMI